MRSLVQTSSNSLRTPTFAVSSNQLPETQILTQPPRMPPLNEVAIVTGASQQQAELIKMI